MSDHGYSGSEYERLNLQVCRVIGAQAAVEQALDRARNVKSTPKWLLSYLESARERLPGLSTDLATMRDQNRDFSIRSKKEAS